LYLYSILLFLTVKIVPQNEYQSNTPKEANQQRP
jgi:hypothetical protein